MDNRIDFICQHTMDGGIIPLKIRLRDEDNELQEYMVKGYRDTSEHSMKSFEIKIVVFDSMKIFKIYKGSDDIWRIQL